MLEAVRELVEETAKLAGSPLWSLADAELISALTAVHRLEEAAAALKARLVHQAATRDIPAGLGFGSMPGWLRAHLLLDPQPARELAEQARALARRPAVEQAALDGLVDLRQAAVITAAVDAIPAAVNDVAPGEDSARIADEAEAVLIGMAAQFPAYQLRRLGDRVLAHVAPQIAEQADEEALRRQEARAHAKRWFTMSLPVDGMVRLSGSLGVEDAAVVDAALQPLCTPIAGDERSAGQRRADALTDVCRLALRTTDLPDHGGEPPQLAVTVPFDPLEGRLRTAVLDNGERLSAESARRIACDARILPVVLGSAGQVLDAGRSRRLAQGALRRALATRDRGCAFPGCDRPPRWCDAHHLQAWSDGGHTSLDNLVLLCRHHHRLLHNPTAGWAVRLSADRLPEFIPPPWSDPSRRPRQNLFHMRT